MTRRKDVPPKTDRKYGFRTPAQRVAKKAAFLAAYAKYGTIVRAAEVARIDRHAHKQWMQDDPEYPARFDEAHEEACQRIEAEIHRRGVEGCVSYKFCNGEPLLLHPVTGEPYYERVYSDRLIELVAKALMPEKYKDRVASELSGPGGGPISVKRADELTDDELARIAATPPPALSVEDVAQ